MSDSNASVGDAGDAQHTKLTTLHHLFLQACISRRNMTESIASKIHIKSCQILGVPHRQQDFPNLITDLNDVLNKLGFALKRSNDPVTGRPHLIFVNTRSDVLAQVATEYSPQEIMYFRMLIEEIMTADDMKFAISTFEAMNLSKEVKPALKKTQAQTLLDSYVAKGWIHRSSRGSYSLSLRSLVELEHYLFAEFEDVLSVKCEDCSEFVTVGYMCPADECEVRMHKHCLESWKKAKSACPGCKAAWPKDEKKMIPIGDSIIHADDTAFPPAVDSDEEPTQPAKKGRKKAAAAPKKGKKKATQQASDEEEDELEESQESPQPKKRRSGRQSQASQKAPQPDPDSDEELDDIHNTLTQMQAGGGDDESMEE